MKDCNRLDLILFPPQDGNDSDKDDALSEDEGDCNIHQIGKGVLRQPLEVFAVSQEGEANLVHLNSQALENNNSDSSEDDVPLAKRFNLHSHSSETGTIPKDTQNKNAKKYEKKKRNWKTTELRQRTEKIAIHKTLEPTVVQRIRDENLQPIDLFRMFFPEDFMKFICLESQKYANFKGKHDFSVSVNEMYIYFGILILSGYCKVPFRRMYWETKADTYNPLISNSISRDRFELIHRFLHFNDNNAIDADNKTYKVQPLIDRVNMVSQSLAIPLGSSFSLDEAMEPYFGHHHMKQFIKGKPIRYGFKFWCLNSSEGYLLKFSPYCGAGDKKEGKTLGTSVTEKLCLNYLPQGSTVFIDNFFNSLPLLDELKSHNINCIGTIRADRVERAPVMDLKKEPRGSSHVLVDSTNGITLIRWSDNSQVTVATNQDDENICLTNGQCKRWSKKEKTSVQVDQPTLINLYNQGMGGVDLFDKMRGLYRIRIRSKKWYWPFLRFCINGALVNMWILYRYVYPTIGLLTFIRRIVLAILTAPQHLSGPKPKCSKNVLLEVRYDRTDHFVEGNPTQRRCAFCGKCTKFICAKCNVGLHPQTCFRAYHTSPQ